MTSLSTSTPSQSKMTALKRSLSGLASFQEAIHALQGAQDVFSRVGIGYTQIPFAQDAEVGAADQRNTRLVEQRIGQWLGVPAGLLDVGEGIEGALGRDAGNPRQLVETFHHQLATLVERNAHMRHRILRPGQGGD